MTAVPISRGQVGDETQRQKWAIPFDKQDQNEDMANQDTCMVRGRTQKDGEA